MKSQYIIIFTIIIALTTSMLFLAYTEKNQREQNQNFWSIYFVAPLTTTDNRFVIDNKTPELKNFHYDIIINDKIKVSSDIEIPSNERKLINTKNYDNTPIKIIVETQNNKKEIYKK